MLEYASLDDCLATEAQALKAAQAAPGGRQSLIWSCSPGLAVSRRDTRLPSFKEASQSMAKLGLPVSVRDSGGSAVVQGPGIVNLTLISSIQGDCSGSFAAEYKRLGAPILEAFRLLEIPATLGPANGAYCDGEYNIVAFGKKVAGTAQRRIRGAVLSHACINLSANDTEMTASINTFYRLAGGTQICDSLASTSVKRLIHSASDNEIKARSSATLFYYFLKSALNKYGCGDVILDIRTKDLIDVSSTECYRRSITASA